MEARMVVDPGLSKAARRALERAKAGNPGAFARVVEEIGALPIEQQRLVAAAMLPWAEQEIAALDARISRQLELVRQLEAARTGKQQLLGELRRLLEAGGPLGGLDHEYHSNT